MEDLQAKMMTGPLLEVNIRAGYKKDLVLDDLSFSMEHGQSLGLVGTSGAGKSTLLLAILGLLGGKNGWVSGSVKLEQQELTGLRQARLRMIRGRTVALIPQSPSSALSPALRLGTHFREAWRAHEDENETKMKIRTQEVLHSVQMQSDADFLRRRSSEISVGQAQRLLIALALLHHPKLIIADEPTSALDPVSRMEILQLLADLTGPGRSALLYVSHDILSVLRLCGQIAVLDGGRIVEIVAARDIARSRSHAAMHLLKSLPVPLELLLEHWAIAPTTAQKICSFPSPR
jgi:peptide/nickel transport system ATP-binding protein